MPGKKNKDVDELESVNTGSHLDGQWPDCTMQSRL